MLGYFYKRHENNILDYSNLEENEEFPDAVTQEELLDAKKRDREKLGSVNLRADEETNKYEEEIKKMVGGYIEIAYDDGNTQIICNEEGKIHGHPYNKEATDEWNKLLSNNLISKLRSDWSGDINQKIILLNLIYIFNYKIEFK